MAAFGAASGSAGSIAPIWAFLLVYFMMIFSKKVEVKKHNHEDNEEDDVEVVQSSACVKNFEG